MILVCSEKTIPKILALATGEVLTMYFGHGSGFPVWGCAWSPSGRIAASCGEDCVALLWRIDTAETLARIDPGGGPLWGVAFARAEGRASRLLCASSDCTVSVWELRSNKKLIRGPPYPPIPRGGFASGK
jgi:WD40 repeat protein